MCRLFSLPQSTKKIRLLKKATKLADGDGRICQINNLITQILGGELSADSQSYSEAIGWWDATGHMINDADGPLSKAVHQKITTHNQPIKILSHEGVEKIIYGSASPLFGRDGKTVGAVAVIQDVTESKKIEKDLENQITKFVAAGVELEERLRH